MIKISRGLDLPLSGAPTQEIAGQKSAKKFGVVASEFIGMRPTMAVKEGDSVEIGQLLFTDKKNEGVRFTSPVNGMVKEINRGERRAFQSVVIEQTGDAHCNFSNFDPSLADSPERNKVRELLVESGEWIALTERPFGKVPHIESSPHSLFINCMDTNALAVNPELPLSLHWNEFLIGLKVAASLTDGKVYCIFGEQSSHMAKVAQDGQIRIEQFKGPHPAGNSGTHIHYLSPVGRNKTAWQIHYQDLIAWGHLFKTGQLMTTRVVSIAGPLCKKPALWKVPLGGCLSEIVSGEIADPKTPLRMVSGPVLSGRRSPAKGPFDYLGRAHLQICLLQEGREREFLGWHAPGFDKFSVKNVFFSKLLGKKKFDLDTSKHGSLRSIVPIGSFEKVMPMDILPTYLLRSLSALDTEKAQALGALELLEEDVALCTFVDPCKNEFGHQLRENLNLIEKEG